MSETKNYITAEDMLDVARYARVYVKTHGKPATPYVLRDPHLEHGRETFVAEIMATHKLGQSFYLTLYEDHTLQINLGNACVLVAGRVGVRHFDQNALDLLGLKRTLILEALASV
jgi:hypothetical protein